MDASSQHANSQDGPSTSVPAEVKVAACSTTRAEPRPSHTDKSEPATCSKGILGPGGILTRDGVGMYPRQWKSIQFESKDSGHHDLLAENAAAEGKGKKRPLEDRETPERRMAERENRAKSDGSSGSCTIAGSSESCTAGTDQAAAEAKGGMTFRLATYNILTDNCIRSGQYLHCAEQIRYMPSRHGHIMDEVAVLSPDVICFQEADKDHYPLHLVPSMVAKGYDGVHAPTADKQGLAIFWRVGVFGLINKRARLTHEAADDLIKTSSSLDTRQVAAVRTAIDRPEMSLGVRLRHLASRKEVVVVTVHIAWTELRWPALQTLQISMGVKMLREMSANDVEATDGHATEPGQVKGQEGRQPCAQILCGDFNTPPHFPGYGMMRGDPVTSSSFQQLEHIRNNAYHGDEAGRLKAYELADVLPAVYKLGGVQMSSAYKIVLGHEPEVTNCDDASEDAGVVKPLCLDYMWFSAHSLDVTGVLETPPLEALTRHHCLPSILFPSDHIPLMAEFAFK